MRQETITKTYLQFSELTDEQKEKAIEENFSDAFHYEFCMEERIDSLKGLATFLKGELDYSLSPVPDRGEFIKIKPIGDGYELNFEALKEIADEDCPFTGVCYDDDLLDGLAKNGFDQSGLNRTLTEYIKSIHDEYEAMTSFGYIEEFCEAHYFEFDASTLKMV